MASQRYKRLEKRLAALRKSFLPDPFSPTGTYEPNQSDHTRGYILLSHAEIETYLEDFCGDIVVDKLSKYTQHGRAGLVLVSLLSHFYHAHSAPDRQGPTIAGGEPSIGIVNKAGLWFQGRLRDNHGIKKDNISKLVGPVGILLGSLDDTWLADMETFGARRGAIAHTSSLGIQQPLDPQTQYDFVNTNLLQGILVLDGLFSQLKRKG